MARAVIGGLITSTLLTLIVVPVVYTYLDDLGAWARAPVAPQHPRPRARRGPRSRGSAVASGAGVAPATG